MRKLLICLFVLSPLWAYAETAEEKGLAIATEADKRNTGWGDQQARLSISSFGTCPSPTRGPRIQPSMA